MKILLITLLSIIGLISCGNAQKKEMTTDQPQKPDCIEVLSFHGAQRCPTCVAIEKQTRTVIETNFSAQVKDGTVIFRIIDLSQPENEPLAERYEVTWSSLLVNKWHNGTEQVTNLTKFAFANARTNPEKFKYELQTTIENLLKK
ncbi:MAG: nitrophenyl compound nitroreductase subunit ArsF family protein [Alistipes sp.]